jgi:hypothetical protein
MTDEIDEGQGRSLSDGANTNMIVERLSTVTAPNQRCRPCICGLDKLDVQSSHASGQQEINKEESVSDDLSRESVLSFPRDRPEVEVMVGNRPCAPEVGDGDATAQGPNPGTTQHEDSTLTAVGVVGYEVTLDPEAAIFVPRKRGLAPVEDAHCYSGEGIVPAVARTAHASASAPQVLVAIGPKSLYVKGNLEGAEGTQVKSFQIAHSTTEGRDRRSNVVEGQMGERGMEHQGGQITMSGARPLAKREPSVTFISTTASPKEQTGTDGQHLGEAVTSAKPRRDDSVKRFPASRGKIAVGVTPECMTRHLHVSDPSKLLANVLLDEGVTVGHALELESTKTEVRRVMEEEARKVGGDVAVEFFEENMDDWRGKEAEPEPPPKYLLIR